MIFVFFAHKNYSRINDVSMSLLPFCALNMSVALRSMQGQIALGFIKKNLNLCSKDERRGLERHEGE